jgi:competence protein ComGD
MNKWPAFTVVETIIVLGMVIMLLVMTMPNLNPVHQQVAEQQFWQTMRQNWQRAQVTAQLTHRGTIISYDHDSQQIDFRYPHQCVDVDIPSSLRVVRFGDVDMQEDGYVAPQTMTFDSKDHHRRYQMKIQLAWGGYRLEKTNY